MEPISFAIPKIDKGAIHLQEDRSERFYNHLHIHPEVQIMWIKEGKGTLICGDYMGEYLPGDVFIIGSNVPHIFRTISSDDKEYSHAYSVFFPTMLITEYLFSQGDQAT